MPRLQTARIVAVVLLCHTVGGEDAQGSAERLMAAAKAYHAAGRATEAEQALREVMSLSPFASIAAFELGNCMFAPLQSAADAGLAFDDGRGAEAEAAFRAALAARAASAARHAVVPVQLRAPLGMAYNNLANVVSLRGRHREAEALLRVGLAVQPIAYQYNGLASLLVRRAEESSDRSAPSLRLYQEAAGLLEQAIVHESAACASSPPRHHVFRHNLAHVLTRLERADEASWQLETARQAESGHDGEQGSDSTARGALSSQHRASGHGSDVHDDRSAAGTGARVLAMPCSLAIALA